MLWVGGARGALAVIRCVFVGVEPCSSVADLIFPPLYCFPCRSVPSAVESWDCTALALLPNLLRNSASASPSFPPLAKGGQGGGPVSVECTSGLCLARSIDEVDWVCAASAACVACRLQTSLQPNGDYTDDAEVLRPTPGEANAVWPTPPTPPSQGGEKKAACANNDAPLALDFSTQSTPTLQRARAKPLLSLGWSRSSPARSPFQHLVGPGIGRAKLLLSQHCDGVAVMTVGRVIQSNRDNTLSPKRFRRKPHLRRFVRVIQSTRLKFISYKSIWRIHDLRAVGDGLCGLFSHPNIKHYGARCCGESGVMPIIRSSCASDWHITLYKVHIVSIVRSSKRN